MKKKDTDNSYNIGFKKIGPSDRNAACYDTKCKRKNNAAAFQSQTTVERDVKGGFFV